ncbi:MAG: hypothetical protein HYZ28_16050 [Myxococcales bacterium]|nr:hypothetical protein [Myxococcales bacterium]
MTMRFGLAFLWLAVLCLLWGCGSCRRGQSADAGPGLDRDWLEGRLPDGASAGSPVSGGTLVVRAMVEPGGLNYLHDSYRHGWTARMTLGLVAETLTRLDPSSYEILPLLAERWEESEDHLTHTFHLRRKVTFHDGAPLSSKDVAAVMDAVMSPKLLTGGVRADFADLATYRAPDEHTFVVQWRRPSPLGFRQFAKLPIYPAASLQGDFDRLAIARAPIGTGPFRFERWETGKEVSLVRHQGYWGEKAHLDRIVFRIVKDHTIAAQLFERGEFGLMTNVQPAVWRSIEEPGPQNAWARGYHRIRSTDNSYSYIAWNQARPFFADARVRRALAHLYPAETIFRNVDLGLELPTTCPYFIDGPYCDPAVKPFGFDSGAARALLSEAGWKDSDGDGLLDKDGTAFRFSFLMPPNAVRLGKLGPLLKEEFRKVGIEMSLEKLESAVLSERVNRRDFDAISRVWTEFDLEQDLSQVFHSSERERGSNFVGYSNPELDALLERSRGEPDRARRVELSRRIHRILYQDQPYLFMTARQSLDAAKKEVRGLRPSLVWYDLSRTWIAR